MTVPSIPVVCLLKLVDGDANEILDINSSFLVRRLNRIHTVPAKLVNECFAETSERMVPASRTM